MIYPFIYDRIWNDKEWYGINYKGWSMDIKNWLRVEQVAKKIGLTEERVRELINLKEIKATKIGRWWIKPEDLENFIKTRTNK